jgi:hypothetical protein
MNFSMAPKKGAIQPKHTPPCLFFGLKPCDQTGLRRLLPVITVPAIIVVIVFLLLLENLEASANPSVSFKTAP